MKMKQGKVKWINNKAGHIDDTPPPMPSMNHMVQITNLS